MSPQASAEVTVAAQLFESHVHPGDDLVRWVRGALSRQESCLAFVCGAAGSGKSHLALQASFELGASACVVSDDLYYEDYNALPLNEFTQALENATQSPPMAIICDDMNIGISDFASKVVLGLGAGIASRQIAWFVADKGLPEAKEVQALRKAQPFSLGPAKAEVSADTILGQVRKVRATFFRNGALVQWNDTFVSTEMLRSCWQEVLDWDPLRPQQAPSAMPYIHDGSTGVLAHTISQDDEAPMRTSPPPRGGPVHLAAGWAFAGTLPGPVVPTATHFLPAPATPAWVPALSAQKMAPPPLPSPTVVGPHKPVPPPLARNTLVMPPAHLQGSAPSSPPTTCANPLSTLLAQCNLTHGLQSTAPMPLGPPHLPLPRPGALMLSHESAGGDLPKPIGLTLGSVLNDYMKGSKPCTEVPQFMRY